VGYLNEFNSIQDIIKWFRRGTFLKPKPRQATIFKKKTKVIIMVDLTQQTIKKIFNERIREITKRTLAAESLDFQFSDRWIHA